MAGKLENDEDPRKTGSLELEPRYSDQSGSDTTRKMLVLRNLSV